jgi:EAL domain-containing protein (putative c-di-GMP-specific phosphodiesterase class I)
VLLQNTAMVVETLHQIRELGVRFAMDDFGTGYSSLSYLSSFPFDKIKIDRSFVRELGEKKDSVAIIRAVTGLSDSLGMVTTAEGVETREQLEILRTEGCKQVQGYLINAPRPAKDIPRMLKDIPALLQGLEPRELRSATGRRPGALRPYDLLKGERALPVPLSKLAATAQ